MPKRKRKTEEDGGSKSLNHLAAVAVATVATMPVKYKGVSKSGKKGKKFYAQIRVDGIMQRLGTYDTSKEAAQAYDLAAIHAGRPRSKLNFLNQVPKNYKVKGRKLLSTNTIGFSIFNSISAAFNQSLRNGTAAKLKIWVVHFFVSHH